LFVIPLLVSLYSSTKQEKAFDVFFGKKIFQTNIFTRDKNFNELVLFFNDYSIFVASKLMVILCLSSDLKELKDRFSKIIVGYNFSIKSAYPKDLKAENAIAVLFKDAIKPNLV